MRDKTTGEAIQMLLHSRKFLLLCLDCLISVVLYFVAKYATGSLDDVKFLIAALQVPVAVVIYAIAKDNASEALAEAGKEIRRS